MFWGNESEDDGSHPSCSTLMYWHGLIKSSSVPTASPLVGRSGCVDMTGPGLETKNKDHHTHTHTQYNMAMLSHVQSSLSADNIVCCKCSFMRALRGSSSPNLPVNANTITSASIHSQDQCEWWLLLNCCQIPGTFLWNPISCLAVIVKFKAFVTY